MEQTAYLILENGTVFEGKSFGAAFDVTGELVFTTAMTVNAVKAGNVFFL